MDADQPQHPDWCVLAFCTIDRPPLNGHVIGVHRSAPTVVEALVIRLVQATGAPPRMELLFGDSRMRVPLRTAAALPPAVDDLLEKAGVTL